MNQQALIDRYIGEGGRRRPHREHPNPSHWARVWAAAFKRDQRCRCCGRVDDLECHHITYERWGAEIVEDVTIVCHYCHVAVHTAVSEMRLKLLFQLRRGLRTHDSGQRELIS